MFTCLLWSLKHFIEKGVSFKKINPKKKKRGNQKANTLSGSNVPASKNIPLGKYTEEEKERKSAYLEKKKEEERENARKKREEAQRNAEIVKENIRKQREEQNAKLLGLKSESSATKVNTTPIASSYKPSGEGKCVLQIRVPGAPPIKVEELSGKDTLHSLHQLLKEKHSFDFDFSLVFLNKTLSEKEKTLSELGLFPRAALNLIKEEQKGVVVKGEEIVNANPNPFLPGRRPPAPFPHPFNPLPPNIDVRPPNVNPPFNPNPRKNKTIVSIYKKEGDKEDVCAVCQGVLNEAEEIRTLSCLHFFHRECIDEWRAEGKPEDCPECEMQDEQPQHN